MSACIDESKGVSLKPSLLISDRHLLVAQGLAKALSASYEIQGVFASGRELEQAVLAHAPDAVVTEINLLDQSAIDTLKRVRAMGRNIPFVICTSQTSPGTLRDAFYSGALGVIAKSESIEALKTAIGLATESKVYLSNAFMRLLTTEQQMPAIRLTARQKRVLVLLDCGLSAQKIADQLGLSRRTVESHKARLFRITDTHSPRELLVRADQLGLLTRQDRTLQTAETSR